MTTAERARAGAQRTVFWRVRKPKTHMNVAAVTSARMVHAENLGIGRGSVNLRACDSADHRPRLTSPALKKFIIRPIRLSLLVGATAEM